MLTTLVSRLHKTAKKDAEIATVNKIPEKKRKKYSDNSSTPSLSLKNNLGYFYMLPVHAYM